MSHRFFHFSVSLFPMAHFASFGMQWAASAIAMTKGEGSEGGVCEAFDVDDWMKPSISPSLSSKQQGMGKWGKEEQRHGGEIEISLLGSKPLPAQRKALSLCPSPIHSLKRCSHWEPSWLDIIFSSYPLMIVAQCQKLPILSNSSTSQSQRQRLYKLSGQNHLSVIMRVFFVKNYQLYLFLEALALTRIQIDYKATLKQGLH